MPTYQYTCTECSQPLEVVQSFSDDALTECPACGGRLRKVFSAVGIVFKGSGFYRNDSRTSTNGKTTSSTNGDNSKSESTSEAKTSSSDGSKSSASTSGSDSSSSSSTSTKTAASSTS